MAPEPTTENAALIARVTEYVNALGDADQASVAAAVPEAVELVTHHIGAAQVPEVIRERAIVEVAAELFYRKMARNGVMEFGGTDLAPFRIRNDPMKAVYPLLRPYLPWGFA